MAHKQSAVIDAQTKQSWTNCEELVTSLFPIGLRNSLLRKKKEKKKSSGKDRYIILPCLRNSFHHTLSVEVMTFFKFRSVDSRGWYTGTSLCTTSQANWCENNRSPTGKWSAGSQSKKTRHWERADDVSEERRKEEISNGVTSYPIASWNKLPSACESEVPSKHCQNTLKLNNYRSHVRYLYLR